MSPTELKMQPTIHFIKKLAILMSIASFFRKCSVGCIFNYVGLITTREIPCILLCTCKYYCADKAIDKAKIYN
jgi:hypothetical protein